MSGGRSNQAGQRGGNVIIESGARGGAIWSLLIIYVLQIQMGGHAQRETKKQGIKYTKHTTNYKNRNKNRAGGDQ